MGITRAPAEVAVDGVGNLLAGRPGILPQQFHARENHPGRAKAALQTMTLPKRLLYGMELSVAGEPLDRGHLGAIGLHGENRARLHRLPVEENGAGAAKRRLTTDVGPGQITNVAQEVDEQEARLNLVCARSSVDADGDGDFHRGSSRVTRVVIKWG